MAAMGRIPGTLLSILIALVAAAGGAHAQSRVALIVGNGAYQHAPELPRTVQDAGEMAKSFERLGFTTIKAFDASYNEFRSAIRTFNDQTRSVEYAVVYFAGYGVDMRGENYLLPTDADLRSELDVLDETISLHSLMQSVGRSSELGLIILDASRNSPIVARTEGSRLARALNRGLARVEPSQNVVVAYAARDGTVAENSGLYTPALLKYLETPGLDISLLFRKVRDEVLAQSDRRQQPFVYGSLPNKPVYLKEPSIFILTGGKDPAADETVWQAIRESADSHLFSDFLEKFPYGLPALPPAQRAVAQRLSALAHLRRRDRQPPSPLTEGTAAIDANGRPARPITRAGRAA
jgi:hypothetical protein